MPKPKVILASIVAVVTIAVVTIAVAPLADESSKPPAVRAAAGAPLGSPPLAASAASAGERDPQGG